MASAPSACTSTLLTKPSAPNAAAGNPRSAELPAKINMRSPTGIDGSADVVE